MTPSNIRQNPIRFIVIVFIIVVVLVVGFFATQYMLSRKSITVTFSHIAEVKLIEYRTLREVGSIKNSGDSVSIVKDVRYKLKYSGIDGYASGELNIDNKKDTVAITPSYSREKLDSLLTDSVVDTIHTTITNRYPHIADQYTLERGKLYSSGDWYATSLVYKGGYNSVSDTLRIILRKTPEGWEIVTSPNLTFDKFNNPGVPVDILKQVNNS